MNLSESSIAPPLQVKVYHPTEDQFRDMAGLLNSIESDPHNIAVGLAKVIIFFSPYLCLFVIFYIDRIIFNSYSYFLKFISYWIHLSFFY